MKILLPSVLFIVFGLMMAQAPDEAFVELMDAFYAGDAVVVQDHLSFEAVQMIDMMLMMIRIQPEQSAAEFSRELQIAVTGAELMSWTATEFISAVINSPGIRDGLPSRESIQVSGCDVDGDTGTVYLTVMNYPEAVEISMVRESDGWKLGESLIESEL